MKIKSTRKKLHKRILLEIVKIMKKHIIYKLKDSRAKKISKVAESKKTNVDNGSKI